MVEHNKEKKNVTSDLTNLSIRSKCLSLAVRFNDLLGGIVRARIRNATSVRQMPKTLCYEPIFDQTLA